MNDLMTLMTCTFAVVWCSKDNYERPQPNKPHQKLASNKKVNVLICSGQFFLLSSYLDYIKDPNNNDITFIHQSSKDINTASFNSMTI